VGRSGKLWAIYFICQIVIWSTAVRQHYLFDDVFLLRKNLLDRVCFAAGVAPLKTRKTDVGRAFCFT